MPRSLNRLTLLLSIFAAISAASASDREALHARPDKAASRAVGFFVDPGDGPFVPQENRSVAGRAAEPQPRRVRIEPPQPKNLPIRTLPDFRTTYAGKFADRRPNDEIVLYSVVPRWQRAVSDLVRRADAPHVAMVVIEPATGRILAVDDKSSSIAQLSAHGRAPAASLFKIVTSAAALERSKLRPNSMIRYRGGMYTLERWNYKPDAKRDRLALSLADALGKSCNAVFARVALQHLDERALEEYAEAFGFNGDLEADHRVDRSTASIPHDPYLLSRTAAGFGEVRMSAIHAAALMAGVANGGVLPSPKLIDRVIDREGNSVYAPEDWYVRRMIEPETAQALLDMMISTTTTGTSRREFMRNSKPVLGIPVAAKTGTLRGKDPVGINHWFVAAAPAKNPQVALAVLVVSNGATKMSASRMGRMFLQEYFGR